MRRYIDAEVLKSRLEDFSSWCKDGRKEGVDFVLDCPLPDTPTADVQEVVRCKVCKYFDTKDLLCERCGDIDEPCGACHYHGGCTNYYGYCHRGERR